MKVPLSLFWCGAGRAVGQDRGVVGFLDNGRADIVSSEQTIFLSRWKKGILGEISTAKCSFLYFV